MKHVVVGKENGKPVFNREFFHFAHHYGFSRSSLFLPVKARQPDT